MCHTSSIPLVRGACLALALASFLLLPAQAQPAAPDNAPRLEISGVRIASYSEDGSEATFRVEYKCTSPRGQRLRLEVTPLREGKDDVAQWFRCDPAWVQPGGAPALVKLRYAGDSSSPYVLLTDDVVVQGFVFTNNAVIRSRQFPKVVAWRQALKPAPDEPTLAALSPVGRADEFAPRTVTAAAPLPEPAAEPVQITKTVEVIVPEVAVAPAPVPAPAVVPAEEPVVPTTPASPTPSALPATVVAQVQPAAPADNTISISTRPAPKSDWLERFTLGPGDTLNLGLLGSPELTRTDVVIAPDGRISFLEAQDVKASGLTVDELREALEKELSKFRHSPRTLVSPVAYRSKKYYLLGQAVRPGAFTMDRPITVVEAVARARGIQPGTTQGRIVDLADLSHSFLARNGERMTVDFEKLFLHGDLSQNVTLAPGDYLYFPPAETKEVYVLGEVHNPGALAIAGEATTVRAIASRGGFTPKAWKGKVLVIRGSLNSPQTFAVDISAIVTGRSPDFLLEPRDIVYVSARPWIRAEELLDLAASSFVQAAVIVWTGGSVSPIFR